MFARPQNPHTQARNQAARPRHRGLRIAGAALIAWLPTGFAVVAAAADWNAYIVLTLALGGLVTTATLAAFVWEVSYGD
jgi:hypothetical protein